MTDLTKNSRRYEVEQDRSLVICPMLHPLPKRFGSQQESSYRQSLLFVLTHLLQTLTPTPVPFLPQGITPPSLAIRCSNGTACPEARSEGEPNMIVKFPLVAAVVPDVSSCTPVFLAPTPNVQLTARNRGIQHQCPTQRLALNLLS